MSFVIAFAPFMRVDLTDDGTPAAPVEAFAFQPTARTARVMSNHQIRFREGSNGFSLYYKSNPAVAVPLIAPISERIRFSFTMRLREGGFFDRHHPDFAAGAAQILLDNLDAGGAITSTGPLSAGATVEAADLVAGGPAIYPVRLDVTGGVPTEIEVRDRFTSAVVAETTDIVAEPGATEIFRTVDTRGAADAALRLTAPAPSTLDRPIYADDEFEGADSVGAVDLYWDQPQDAVPAGIGAVFSAVFRSR